MDGNSGIVNKRSKVLVLGGWGGVGWGGVGRVGRGWAAGLAMGPGHFYETTFLFTNELYKIYAELLSTSFQGNFAACFLVLATF